VIERLREWAYDSPIFKARYIERSKRRYILIGMWPLSWSIGIMWDSEGFQLGLGPFGIEIL
jgi:hypothetical protein